MDLIQFARRLKLAVWFNDKTQDVKDDTVIPDIHRVEFKLKDFELYIKSDFLPPTVFHPVETFVNLVKADFEKFRIDSLHKPLSYPNMTHNEIQALNELTNNHTITIKPADKGGGIVVMDTSTYLQEAYRQLGDTDVYLKLSKDPKWDYERELLGIVDRAHHDKLIDDKLRTFLIVLNPITPVLYLLPKIHKTLVDPPGRPIVSGRGSLFNHVSIFLDKILCEFVTQAPSYIRDTNDFLKRLKSVQVPTNMVLASFDITSLYTSTDITEGIEAIRRTLMSTQYTERGRAFIIELLYFVLTRNYFKFEEGFYLQRRGTAMGANVAPSFANIFVTTLESDAIYISHHFHNVVQWWRYIDDIFVIWKGTVEELQDFHVFLNSINRTIKFTLTYSLENITFLDTRVRIEGQALVTELYQKETDRNTLLHYSSGHPRSMVRGLPYSQFIRAKRITQNNTKWQHTLKKMTDDFRARGYPPTLISKHAEAVEKLPLEESNKQTNRNGRLKRIPFVSTFNDLSTKINDVVRKHWNILQNSYQHIPEFQTLPIM